MLHVVQVDPRADESWDAFVEAHPEGWVFHHSAWLQAMEATYGFEPVHLACRDARGVLRGVLPLFRVNGPITGRGLYSLPRTPLGGPLVADNAVAASLIETALRMTDTARGQTLDLRLRSNWLDGVAEGVTGRPVVAAYQLDLQSLGAEPRFGNSANHSKIKRAVNKAAREGVEVRPAETEADLRNWYGLYLEAMRSHGTLPRPYLLIKNLWDLLSPRGMMRLLLAERRTSGRTEMLSGSIFLTFARKVYFLYNGRRRDALPMRPNDAIMWQAIHEAHAEGKCCLDFGEVPSDNPGLAEFKTKWCARPEYLYHYRYPASQKPASESHTRMRSVRRLMRPLWRRTPLRITELLGTYVFNHF
jgi:hypothetical protein